MPSPLFPWLTVEAEQVIAATKLEAHEMGVDLSEEDFQLDAETALDDAAGDVLLALLDEVKPLSWPFTTTQWALALPDSTASGRDARKCLQLKQANAVVKKMAVAALRSDNASDQSLKAAETQLKGGSGEPRLGSAEAMLIRLLADVKAVATAIQTVKEPSNRKRVGAIRMGIGD